MSERGERVQVCFFWPESDCLSLVDSGARHAFFGRVVVVSLVAGSAAVVVPLLLHQRIQKAFHHTCQYCNGGISERSEKSL